MHDSIKIFFEVNEKQIAKLTKQIERVKKLHELYSDLEIFAKNSKQCGCFASTSVNSKVNLYDMPYEGSYDLTVKIYPYIITEYGDVYSNPPCFAVGMYDSKYHITAFDNWWKILQNNNISKDIIKNVSEFLKDNGK